MSQSALLLRRGRWLEYLTIAWNAIEGLIAVGSGVVAGSVALVGFGFDSFIEVFAATVVLWHLRGVSEEREQRALRLIAVSFFALAVYIVIASGRELLTEARPAESMVGIVLAAVSLAVMPALAILKRRTGRQLVNAALIADSAETLLCSYLSATLLAGLLLNSAFGWWWADPAAALVIAFQAAREGREAWYGDHEHA